MYEDNMKTTDTTVLPQEEFLRQVLFMKDEEKVLAVFPFYHNISEAEYHMVVDNFFADTTYDIPAKREFCLMHESEFGWGWIHNHMISHLELADEDDYDDFRDLLISKKVIKDIFIL